MGKIWEISIKGENTEMFTTIPIKQGVWGCKIESKGISKIRDTGMCEPPPPLSTEFPPFSINHFIILKVQSQFYILKNAPWEQMNIITT